MNSTDVAQMCYLLGSVGVRCETDYPLAPLCTYRAGGAARLYCELNSIEDAHEVAAVLAAHRVPVLVVGKGSNLLVADAGFDGMVLQLGKPFDWIELIDDEVVAGGLSFLPVVARKTVGEGLAGFEWAVGVPGSVGGAVKMNAGGHGADVSSSLVQADVLDVGTGEFETMESSRLGLTYRHSELSDRQLVVSARFKLDDGDREESEELLRSIVKWRRENQPGGQNAGSVFANPPGDSAARLIEEAGLKGRRLGTAEVSNKHANFIQALDSPKAGDIYELIRHVQSTVADRTGVILRAENKLVGFE